MAKLEWTGDQLQALDFLKKENNVFLTGGAGTGKSTVIKDWIGLTENTAVLASTGTAAILLGGRTFHSFFGLGIMEGGVDQIVERAVKHRGIVQRLKKTKTVLIDEVSMIGAAEFEAAERIARKARQNSAPWGGLRVISVGDFAQLPPVTKSHYQDSQSQELMAPSKPWAFLSKTWRDSSFDSVLLKSIVRSQDEAWNRVLGEVRWGELTKESVSVLESRIERVPLDFKGTRLFARRAQVEFLNQERLKTLPDAVKTYETLYVGNAQKIDELKRNAPIPETLSLKIGALVMFRQNDPELRFVNGTLGTIKALKAEEVDVELLTGKRIFLSPATFSVLNAEGEVVATATNFPLNLAWACTIHKAQGATLDRVHADLRGVWEHGQSYVALSRVRTLQDLTLEGIQFNRAFPVDPEVRSFYSRL